MRLSALTMLVLVTRIEAATLRGTVTDLVHGTGIPGVIVTVAAPSRTTVTTRTDADGKYAVEPVPKGVSLRVEYSLKGYQGYPTVRDPVVPTEGRAVNVRLLRERQDAAYRRAVAEMIRVAASGPVDAEIRDIVRHLSREEQDEISTILRAPPRQRPPNNREPLEHPQKYAWKNAGQDLLEQLDAMRDLVLASFRRANTEREADARARRVATGALDQAAARYLAALEGRETAARVPLRSAYEQRRAALAAIREREQLHEELLQRAVAELHQLDALARETKMPEDVFIDLQFDVTRSQAALNISRTERESDFERRASIDREQQATIARVERELDAKDPRRELDRMRQELADRDAAERRMSMANELARIAATRQEERGLIVTLSSGLFFDVGKSLLKKGAQTTLARIAEQLKSDSSIKVTVEGHTDNVGTAEKNQHLSEMRAEAVRDFLISTGVPSDRVAAVGKGDTQPIATNKTAAGRQQNRRVELVITQQPPL